MTNKPWCAWEQAIFKSGGHLTCAVVLKWLLKGALLLPEPKSVRLVDDVQEHPASKGAIKGRAAADEVPQRLPVPDQVP